MVISGRKQYIPHIIPLCYNADKSELLVTIANFRFSSLNCRVLGDCYKRDLIKQCLMYNEVDICFLQETHCYSLKCAKLFNRQFGGKLYWSSGTSRSNGSSDWG